MIGFFRVARSLWPGWVVAPESGGECIRQLSLFILLLASVHVVANEPPSDLQSQDISDRFYLLQAPTGQYTADDLFAPGSRALFSPLNPPANVVSHGGDAWLRASLPAGVGDILEIPGQLFNYVDIWFRLPGGTVVHDSSGVRYPYVQRSVKRAGVAFPVPPTDGGPLDVLIRMKNDTTHPINFAAWVWPREQWQGYLFATRAWYGLFVGAILVLCLYNSFLALTLRDPSYLYYVGYIFCLMCAVVLLSGLAEEYLWSDSSHADYVVAFTGMGAFLSVGFVNSFLGIRSISPRTFAFSTVISFVAMILGLSVTFEAKLPFVGSTVSVLLVQASLVLAGLYFVTVSLVSYLGGIVHARFLTLSMSLLLLATVVYFSYTYGHIRYNLLVGHMLEFGALAEGVFLSLALADRINILHQEKREAQQQALEYQLKFSRGLIEVQENERKALAGKMHDSIGHSVLVLKNNLQQVCGSIPADMTLVREGIQQQLDSCGELIQEVRSLSYSLHPHVLERLGLAAAIESTLERSLSSAGIHWHADIAEFPDNLDRSVAITVYRVVQECLNNVLKYSGASEVLCAITVNENRIEARLADNGRGFSQEAIGASTLGLYGMSGRVKLLRGNIEITSESGKGTRVYFSIPLGDTTLAGQGGV